jgi:hypothetical protein
MRRKVKILESTINHLKEYSKIIRRATNTFPTTIKKNINELQEIIKQLEEKGQ